jgi:hypothetical protein
MSTTAVTYPIVAALKTAEQILGPDRAWNPINETQRRFLADFFAACRGEIEGLSEIESIASYSVDEVNAFLRERGFTIQLTPWSPPDFGVASVLNLLVEWIEAGEVTIVTADDGRQFPGVRIGDDGVRFFNVPDHPNPVAELGSKSGDHVYMTMLDQPPDGFDLIARAQQLAEHKRPSWGFGGLVFPMVNLDQKVDITWLIRMQTRSDDGLPARIAQALQQTKLKMNEVGARAESAVAIEITLRVMDAPKPDHVINRPFLIWFERDGLSRPLFAGHITPDDWRNPGRI